MCPGWWLSLLSLLLTPPVAATPEPRRVALLVAISAYPEGSGYPPLHADDDLDLLSAALRSQGFQRGDIHLLRDEEATREGILAAFQRDLIQPARPGDVMVFHYSGHGDRITDDDGDELDGYDEVLAPWGAEAALSGDYAGEQHLRDDELGALVARLRARLDAQGSLLVSLDSCYSGSATRGAGDLPARSLTSPLGPPAATRGAGVDTGSGFDTPSPAGPRLAPFAVFSASSHDELAAETHDPRHGERVVGALSLALSHALTRAPRGATWAELYAMVRVEMARTVPLQTPRLEGIVDAPALGGALHEVLPWYEVASSDDEVVVVRGGRLTGLLPGARVALMPAGAVRPDPSALLAEGEVLEADPLLARVRLDAPPRGDLAGARAFLTELAFGDLVLRVGVRPGVPGPLRDSLAEALERSRLLRLVETGPDIWLGADAGGIDLQTPDGLRVARFDTPTTEAVLPRLFALARGQYLRELELHDDSLDVSMRIVPAQRRLDAQGAFAGCDPVPTPDAGPMVLHPGDTFLLELENRGPEAAWLSVLDITPDGEVAQMFPFHDGVTSDQRLDPGRSVLVRDPCYQVGEPYGMEMLKLIATREPADFRPLLAGIPLAQGYRGAAPGPLALLLEESLDQVQMRSGILRAPRGAGVTQAVVFEVAREE